MTMSTGGLTGRNWLDNVHVLLAQNGRLFPRWSASFFNKKKAWAVSSWPKRERSLMTSMSDIRRPDLPRPPPRPPPRPRLCQSSTEFFKLPWNATTWSQANSHPPSPPPTINTICSGIRDVFDRSLSSWDCPLCLTTLVHTIWFAQPLEKAST